jgi:hypothetical protein
VTDRHDWRERHCVRRSENRPWLVELDPRALRLSLLAPDIVEATLGGWADQRVMLEKLERPLPVRWEEQRRKLIASEQK